MSNEIVTQVRTQLNTDAMRAELMKALPSHMPKGSDERLIRITMSALQKTPKLLRCDPMTIYKAVMMVINMLFRPCEMECCVYVQG